MRKYQNNVISPTGDALANVSVLVLLYPSGTIATIFSDNGVTIAPNPLTTDANGAFSFYADDNHYSLEISGSSIQTITMTDIVIADIIPTDHVAATTVHDTDVMTVEQSDALRAATVDQIRNAILSGTPLAVTQGGTGATNAADARTNLGAAASGANNDITSLTGLTTPIPLAEGGTGGTTQATARTGIGAAALNGDATQNFSVKDSTAANHAVAQDQVFGVGQTFTNVTGSRTSGTTFTNSTGKPIFVYVWGIAGSGAGGLSATVNTVTVGGTIAPTTGQGISLLFVVPTGATYSVAAANVTINNWYELR